MSFIWMPIYRCPIAADTDCSPGTAQAEYWALYLRRQAYGHSQAPYPLGTIHLKLGEGETGLEFETYLMDKQRSCANNCIFCFIDQLPKGLRESLYFKDDDSRLSFLFGNYITLTNIGERDIDRIIEMHISPVNISVHTMNPELRVKMMGNKRELYSYYYNT